MVRGRRFTAMKAWWLLGLLLGLAVGTAATPVWAQAPGTWARIVDLNKARAEHTATLLPNGTVLIAGGKDVAGQPLTSAEIYNPVTGVYSVLSSPLPTPVWGHTATGLNDGTVLRAGGTGDGGLPVNAAVLYDPATDTFAALDSLSTPRARHTATLLRDGKVLIAGGTDGPNALASLEVYDPPTRTFSLAPSALLTPRQDHAASLLNDGRLLVAGGSNSLGALNSAELYDPGGSTVSPAGPPTVPRTLASAALLLDGTGLLAGSQSAKDLDLNTAEVYDPAMDSFTLLPALMSTARSAHTGVRLLHNGKVLLVGGTSAGQLVPTTEVYDPVTSVFRQVGSPTTARQLFGTNFFVEPYTGIFLMSGGLDSAQSPLASSEAFFYPTLRSDKPDYAPGETVTLMGERWRPNETITINIHESSGDPDTNLTATADANGAFTNSEFRTALDRSDVGVRFLATATGQASGWTAQTTFTDARLFTATITPTSATVGTATSYTLTVTNTSTSGEAMDCVQVAIPAGAGTPSSLSVVATDNPGGPRTWSTPSVSGSTIQTIRTGNTNPNSIDPGGTVAISFTATATTSGTKTWTTSAFANTSCSAGQSFTPSGPQPSVQVNQATPALSTTATAGVTIGQGTISDTANLAGGSGTLGGTITFTLYGPNDATCGNAAIFTNTKAVVSSGGGTGTATSDPFTPSQAGTYRWKASYSGDTNNAAIATACNDPGETSVVNQATPTLTTVATPTALVGGSISDTANLRSEERRVGRASTSRLSGPNDGTSGSATNVTNTKAEVSPGGGPGKATSDPFTPSRAGPHRRKGCDRRSADNAADATACNDPGETSVVNQATPTLTTVATPTALVGGSISDTANLRSEERRVGRASTSRLSGPNDGTSGSATNVTNTKAEVSPGGGPGKATSDPFTPSRAGPHRRKGCDRRSADNAADATACNDPGETSVVNQATPTLTTVATPTALAAGSTSDTANLAGGFGTLGGTVTLTLYGPYDATCGNAAIFTNTKAVVSSGGGTVTPYGPDDATCGNAAIVTDTVAVVSSGGGTGTATSDPFTPSLAGTERWEASNRGHHNDVAIATACNDPGETSVITQATPVLT